MIKINRKIDVIDENGKKIELDVIDVINIENNEYIIVSSDDSDNAYAYKAVKNNNEIEYVSLKAGNEFNKVLNAYTARNISKY